MYLKNINMRCSIIDNNNTNSWITRRLRTHVVCNGHCAQANGILIAMCANVSGTSSAAPSSGLVQL